MLRARKLFLTDSQLNIAIMVMVVLCVVLSRPYKKWQPIQASQHDYKFGVVKEGAEVHATFRLKNVSLRSLEITGVEGGCGCTKAFPDKEMPFKLKPFETVVLKTTLDTTHQSGMVQKAIFVRTSGSKKPIEVAALVGTVH